MNQILVVDDSLSVRKVLERLLSSHADVRVAVSAEDALAQLDAGIPTPDLLISDVLMPGMDGLELSQILRQRPDTAQMPIVLISGVLNDELMQQASAAGVHAVIRKPFTVEELQPVILQALATPSALPGTSAFVPELRQGAPNGPSSSLQKRSARQGRRGQTSGAVSSEDQATSLLEVAGPINWVADPKNAPSASATPEPSSPGSEFMHQALLTTLMKKPGVIGTLVTTQDGTVLTSEGNLSLPAADLAMYARFFASSAEVLGMRLASPRHEGVQIDFAPRTLLILPLDGHLLICLLADSNSSSMIRYALRRILVS